MNLQTFITNIELLLCFWKFFFVLVLTMISICAQYKTPYFLGALPKLSSKAPPDPHLIFNIPSP